MSTPRDKSYAQSLKHALTNPEEAAAYLDAALELQEPATLLVALRHVAQAHGMAETARCAGVGEKTLFRVLNGTGNPTVATLTRVLHVMGLRLCVVPVDPTKAHA